MNNNSIPVDFTADSPIQNVIVPRTREINDFKVRRVLPSRERRMVGPFVLFDQMGPETLRAGTGLDVAVHPHIGLVTVTYLFSGELLHRDGLGTIQAIEPGEVNWMTAGSGIAHSERTPDENRKTDQLLFGIQSWIALPVESEEDDCSFAHHGEEELPVIEGDGKTVRLIAGEMFGEKSPVKTFSEIFYADALLDRAAKIQIPAQAEERAVYILEGGIEIAGQTGAFDARQLLVFKSGAEIIAQNSAQNQTSQNQTRLMILGGEPLPEKRFIWWNFVSSREERIEQAKRDWADNRFAPVPEETERIPLPPETRPAPVVRYP